MTYELRTYVAVPGRMADLQQRFRHLTHRLLGRHGIQVLGYWTRTDDPETLVYLVRHVGDAAANWKDFYADPEWVAVVEDARIKGTTVSSIDSIYLDPIDFSPLA